MTRFPLEDFGKGQISQPHLAIPDADPAVDTQEFDTAYNAGWDDAMAQVEQEQNRIGEKLGERLIALERDQQQAIASAIEALEPMLHEVFDKLLPRAAERGFLPLLLEEIQRLLSDGAGRLMLQVAPEETQALSNLLEQTGLSADQVTVRAEPALSISQALIRWDDQERRIDLETVLTALDDALDSFLNSVKVEPTNG